MKFYHPFFIFLALFFISCSNNEPSKKTDSSPVEVSINAQKSGAISNIGEVDWYHYKAVEANSVLNISVSSNTLRPDVDLLVTVFEQDASGVRNRIYAAHAREDSVSPANIKMNVYIETPKDLYISVRDLLDDDASDNEYYLTLSYTGQQQANNNFSSAQSLTVDDPASCLNDAIGHIGDIDVFAFDAAVTGIYDIKTLFTPFPGTSVTLKIQLYDDQGNLIHSLRQGQSLNYDSAPYLIEGKHYILIHDDGKDDFDLFSTFEVCVNSVDVDEMKKNDTMQTATAIENAIQAGGAIGYTDDNDWYVIHGATGFDALELTFDDEDDTVKTAYQVKIVDDAGSELLSHTFHGGSTQYHARIPDDANAPRYVQVTSPDTHSASAPYTFTLSQVNINDADEAGAGNNTINTALSLTPSANPINASTGKISYRQDEDWYSLTITDTANPQILELFFESESVSDVDYDLHIFRDGVEKRMFDANGSDGVTQFKTALLIPASDLPQIVYSFKVADYQNNEGDDVNYTIRANLSQIPTSAPVGVYHNEATETTDASELVTVIGNAIARQTFTANTSALDFLSPSAGITFLADTDTGLTTIEFPWISGYVDYQGDQDFFRLPNQPLVETDTSWYYDIKIEFAAAAPGSEVEYVWKFYPDTNNNNKMMYDEAGKGDGFLASAGDQSTDVEALNVTTPEANKAFWIGKKWAGSSYFSIHDFNYIKADHPDDDWGYDVPYAFKLTLVYHPGQAAP